MLLLWNSFLGIEEGIISLLLLIDSTLYWAFSKLFSLYVELASARVFDINDFDNLVHNIYLLIGVVALFLISYLLLKNMVSTDEKTSSKEILDIIKRFVVVIILIPLVPVFFDFLYDFQNSLLSNQTITKLMLGNGDVSVPTNVDVEFHDENGNPIYGDDCKATSLEEAKQICTPLTSNVDLSGSELLKDYGNQAAYYVLSGFIYPEDGFTAKEIKTNASEYFNLGHNVKWASIACLVGGGIAMTTVIVLEVATSPATGFATLAAVPATVGTFSAAIIGSCGLAALSSGVIDALGYAITYDEYTWEMAQYEMITTGEFNRITSFAENITGGELHYTPVISTIAAIFLLYMMFSFCLDLGVRAVKLIFFQLMAPICFLISVIPKKKDLLNNWFKLVLTTWLEVFVRIFCVCGVVLFISMLDYDSLKNNFSTFATAILILGIVTFAKQLPKLFSQVTGIDSGNMKLGIKEKLAEGGAFTAGAIIGGGATAFARNAVNAGRNFMGNYEKDANGKWKRKKEVTNWDLIKSGISGAGSIAAGTASAQFRSGKAGLNAKSFGDMKKAASKGAKDAVQAREERALYKSRHGGNVVGAMVGHVTDAVDSVGMWAGFNNIEDLVAKQKTIKEIQSQRKAIDNEAFDIIDGDFAKGKLGSKLVYDAHNTIGASLGITHSMDDYRNLKAKLDEARAKGNASDIQKYEIDVAKYQKDWADEISDIALKGESNWNSLDESVRAELSKLRIATDTYRENVARHYTEGYVSSLTDASKILDKQADLTVKHSTLDNIKDKMKIEDAQLTSEINQRRQKEQDKKGNNS